jgi:hypothetical protein
MLPSNMENKSQETEIDFTIFFFSSFNSLDEYIELQKNLIYMI